MTRFPPRSSVSAAVLLAWVLPAVGGIAPVKSDSDQWTALAERITAERLAARRLPVALEVPALRLASEDTAPADSPPEPRHLTLTRPASQPLERGPLPSLLDTVVRDLQMAPKDLWRDTKKTYGNPYNLVFLLGAGGASLALRPEVDDDIEDHYDHHHSLGRDERVTFDVVGNPGTHFAIAGAWYLAGQMLQEVKTYEVGKRMFSALIITDLTTVLLKVSANTEAPNGTNLAWPSGHVSSTMALATVLNDAYGPVVGVPMYGLTALAAIQRLDDREHHFSDVIFGAALGWVVAETVMKEHRPEIFGGQLVPYLDPDRPSAGVAWLKTIGQ